MGASKLALASVLLGRLYYLQVMQGDKYSVLSEENRISLRLIVPPRGLIKDRNGVILAENQRNYRLLLVPEKNENSKETISQLANLLKLGESDLARIHRDMARKRSFMPILIREQLNWDEVSLLELNNPDFPGTEIEVGQARNYPFAEVASHVLGYVAPVSEAELQKQQPNKDPLLQLPEFRVGKKGIEMNYESRLRGQAGSLQLEVNAYGRIIRELDRVDGKPGEELLTSIDIELQKQAMQLLDGQSGSVVLLDAHSGEVLVLASAPGFDPNTFNKGLSVKEWEALLNNPRGPLNNKAISGLYAPGSTFKLVTALAALESGMIDQNHRVYCEGHTELGTARFHCWKRGGHGTLDMVGAMRESCDVYFYDIAQKIGIDRLSEMSEHLGLGRPTGIDLPGEKSGLVPSRAWKRKRFNASWQKGETLIAGIGQGYILMTPLQLAVMTAQIVNGGKIIKPQLTAGQSPHAIETLRLAKSRRNLMIEAMNQVSNAPNGTAYGARIHEEGFELGGKTGTAQVRRISLAERAGGVIKNEDRPWKERDHALFVGFAPVHDPKYVVSVVVEHGGGGSAVAAPIARDILLAAQQRALASKTGTA